MEQEEVWDNISRKWNKFKVVVSPTVEKFLENKKGKILDIGCGSGRNFMKIESLNWFAIDFSSKMIEFAKKKADKLNMELCINKSESDNLPFEDEYFDSIICVAVLHCIDTPEKRVETLKEIFRVLKKDGEALISAWGKKSPRIKEKESFVPWTVKEKKEKQLRYTYIFDLDELVKLCKEVGFEIVNSWEERNVNVIVRKR